MNDLFKVYPIYDIDIVRASGSTLWDSNGVEYLDMYGGHAVISIGHTAPRYVEYITNQLNTIGFYSNSVKIPIQERLAAQLKKIAQKPNYSLFLCNSGAEANENAMKLASFHNKKSRVIAFSGSFHGRTSLAVAATDSSYISAPVNYTDNVKIIPHNDIEALKSEFEAGGVSSVIIEPIQGVGGITVASVEFLRAIRELCDRYDAVMISDCVQCGCGRSGKYFALDHSGVDADIYSMAKGIANGFPIGGVLISDRFEAKFGMLGTTFGGNHLACAAALAVADEIEHSSLIENACEVGRYLISELEKLNHSSIVELRGVGLMIGIVLDRDSKEIRSRLLFDEKIFVGSASDNRIIRLLPSLTITKAHCDRLVASLKKLL